jgi:hypothetical protein
MRDDGRRFTLPKPVDRQARHVRLSNPRRVELRAESYDEQRRKSFNAIHRSVERLKTRRIDPMHILEDHQHRAMACQSGKLCRQGFQRSLSALLWSKVEYWIASIVRQREHLGKERGILRWRKALG